MNALTRAALVAANPYASVCPLALPYCERRATKAGEEWEELITVQGTDWHLVRLDDGGWWHAADPCESCLDQQRREEAIDREFAAAREE